MKVIVSLDSKAPSPAVFAQYEAAEADRVWQLYEAGTLKEIYLMAERVGAVLVLECADAAAAEAAVASLPMVKAGLFQVALTPLGPWPEMSRMLRERDQELPAWWPDRAVRPQ